MSVSDRLKAMTRKYYELPADELSKHALMVLCPECGKPTWTTLYSFEVPETALTKNGLSGTGNCNACGKIISWNGEMVVKESDMEWKNCHLSQ